MKPSFRGWRHHESYCVGLTAQKVIFLGGNLAEETAGYHRNLVCRAKKAQLWLFPLRVFAGCPSHLWFSSVQSLSRVRLFAIPWIIARQASLSITNSRSSLRLTSIKSVMPSSHLIFCRALLLLSPNPSQHQSLFQWVNSSHEVAKVLEFQL